MENVLTIGANLNDVLSLPLGVGLFFCAFFFGFLGFEIRKLLLKNKLHSKGGVFIFEYDLNTLLSKPQKIIEN